MRAHWQGLESSNFQGFPGGSMVKKPSANAGDMGSTHDSERSHMLQSKLTHVPLLNLCSRAWKLQLLSPHVATTEALVPKACAPQQKKPVHPN